MPVIYKRISKSSLIERKLLVIYLHFVLFFFSVFCPSFSRRERLLKWASNRLPLTWSSQSKTLSGGISDLWHDGSLLCTLINTAIPGACPNPHRHWRKPPTHAQAIAYKYFGLVPVSICFFIYMIWSMILFKIYRARRIFINKTDLRK